MGSQNPDHTWQKAISPPKLEKKKKKKEKTISDRNTARRALATRDSPAP
jgi:hypothetical protein